MPQKGSWEVCSLGSAPVLLAKGPGFESLGPVRKLVTIAPVCNPGTSIVA